MAKDPAFLRKRFLNHIEGHWIQNDHSLKEIACVYVIASYNPNYNRQDDKDIVYVGSTSKLYSRYKSHNIPLKVQRTGNINIMYFMPLAKSFYEYEIKLIKKLKPTYNKQHKNGT